MQLNLMNFLKLLINPTLYIQYAKRTIQLSPTSNILSSFWEKTNLNFKKLNTYYLRNEHLWLDGFLFDFLQKKTADLWIRKFVIYTGFLFSERLVFDVVVKLYMDYFVWYLHKLSIFEVNNVFEMLNTIIYLLLTLFFTILLIIIVF
jgi:hypothetical protein